MSHKTPAQVLKDQIMSYGKRGCDFKAACQRLGVSPESAVKHCGFTEEELETFSAAGESADAANKSQKLLNRALQLTKSGYTGRQVCNILNCTPSALEAAGLPGARHHKPSYVRAIGAQVRKSTGINTNLEFSQRMYGGWQGVTALDMRKSGSTSLKAKTAAAGMRDRSSTNVPVDSPGEITRGVVPTRPNRNQAAVSIFTGAGHGPTSSGEDDLTSLYEKCHKGGTMQKAIHLPETGEYNFDQLQRHVENAIDGINTFRKRMSLDKAITDIATRLPTSIRSLLIKTLYLRGTAIPDELSYLLG